MTARAAPMLGALLGLALFWGGSCWAMSLRNSAAEAFLGDVVPGTEVVFSRIVGSKLRVENSSGGRAKVELKVVSPSRAEVHDGCAPWPYPERVRMSAARADLGSGEGVETELSVAVPKDPSLIGGQYEFDIVATGHDGAGVSLPLRTRVLLSVGAPLPPADVPAGGFADRPGFDLAPPSASGREAAVKIVNAGEEDLAVTLSPARYWSEDVRIRDGYEPVANPRWLRVEPGTATVRAGAIARARVWADVPKETRYAGRRFALVMAVDAVAGGRRSRRYFVLYADMPAKEEETRVR